MFAAIESFGVDSDNLTIDDDTNFDEALFAAHDDIVQEYDNMQDLMDLSETIDNLYQLHGSIESYGITPSLMSFANKDQLLSSALPIFAACESVDITHDANSPESTEAKKSLIEKIKETTARWFKHAWDTVTGWGAKIANFSKAAYNKIAAAGQWAASKTWDATKAVGRTIQAHPVATAFAVIAALSSIALTLGGLSESSVALPKTADEFKAFCDKFKGKLHLVSQGTKTSVFDKKTDSFIGSVSAVSGHKNITNVVIKKGTAEELGYTKENYFKLITDAKNLFGPEGALDKLSETFKIGLKKMVGMVPATEALVASVEENAHWARRAIAWLFQQIWHLWKSAPATTLRIVTNVLSTFKHFFV